MTSPQRDEALPGWAIESGTGGFGDKGDLWVSIRHLESQCGQDFYKDRDPLIFSFLIALRAALASSPAAQVPEWTDADADAARLALELECMLTDKDVPTATVSRWWDSAHEALELHRKRLAAALPAPPQPRDEFCWLVELFEGDGTWNSAGFYHTGFTDLGGHSRTTKTPHKARRYATREQAEQVAQRLGTTLTGTWKAVEHGFSTPTPPQPARSLTDELMDCVDRLGSEADSVDPRVWDHLLVYAPKERLAAQPAAQGEPFAGWLCDDGGSMRAFFRADEKEKRDEFIVECQPLTVTALYAAPHQPAALTDAARDVLAERERQVTAEGWTPEHDDGHDLGELAAAAAAYAVAAADEQHPLSQGDGAYSERPPIMWLWSDEWWKPGTPRRMLVKSAALALAAIEQIDRMRGIGAQEG